MKVAIIGEKKSVLAFKSLGVEVFGVENKEDFSKARETLGKNNFAVVFITEDTAFLYEKEIEEMMGDTLPAVLTIPGVGEKSSSLPLKKILERALGSDKLIN